MRTGPALIALTIVVVACGGTTTRSPVTTASTSTTSTVAPTTTTAAPSTTTTTMPPSTTSTIPTDPPDLGYVLSDDYTVETIAIIPDSAAGGLVYVDGVLYSADFGSHARVGDRIYRVQLDGSVELHAQIPGMDRGTAIVPDDDGHLLVASFLTGLIFDVAPDGTAEVHDDTSGAPGGLTLTSADQLVVGDCTVNRVFRLRTGRPPFDYTRGDDLACPVGIDFDSSGNLYVAGFQNGLVLRTTTSGELIVVHEFASPNSDIAYLDGQLFVANRDTHAIYRIDLESGIVDIIAGNGLPGSADGPGSEATLWTPMSIAIGEDGVLYVSHGLDGAIEPTVIRALVPVPVEEEG